MPKILHLTLKKKWFDLIACGKKTVEYRDDKPYWATRLMENDGKQKHYDEIWFRNGYSKTSPFMRVEYLGCDWVDFVPQTANGEVLEGPVFEIKLGKVLSARG